MELFVGWRELPVPRHPWEVSSAWASIVEARRDVRSDEVFLMISLINSSYRSLQNFLQS